MPKVQKKSKPVFAARPPKPKQQQAKQAAACSPSKKAATNKQILSSRGKTSKPPRPAAQWHCASVIDQQSSEVLEELLLAAETRRGVGATIKSLTLAPHIVHKKPTFAVTCETLKHLPLLKQLVASAGLIEQHQQQLSPAAAYVLAYEVLFGQGFRHKGPAEKAVLKHQDLLKSGLQQLYEEAGVKDAAAWLQLAQQQQQQQQPTVQHPRHARVNTLKAGVQQVLQQLQQQDGLSAVVDGLLPDLLVLPPGTDLHNHPLLEQGKLILQSKASCMPAHALQPRAGWHVVDCCAAPGNKTTHAAALLHASTAAAAACCGSGPHPHDSHEPSTPSKRKRRRPDADAGGGDVSAWRASVADATAAASVAAAVGDIRVFAFDKDPKRLQRLTANVDRAGAAHIVTAQRADFLTIDPLDPQYAKVQGVILDPSCSGSGTVVSRMDHLLPTSTADTDGTKDAEEQQRVKQLARFQEAALLHALKFPGLQRLVYSTCSIHQRENEDVVAAVLPTATASGFRLVDPFPAWHRRGLPVVQGAELLVRTDAHKDGTDGFFVAVFERSRDDGTGADAAGQQLQQEQGDAGQTDPSPHKKKRKKLRNTKHAGTA